MKTVILGAMAATFAWSLAGQWYVLQSAGAERLREVQFVDSLQGWTIGQHRAFRSTDRGRSWVVEKSLDSGSAYTFGGLSVVDSSQVFVSHQWCIYPHWAYWKFWIEEWSHGEWTTRYYKDNGGDWAPIVSYRLCFIDALHGWSLAGYGASRYGYVAVMTGDGGATWDGYNQYAGGGYDVSFTDTVTGWASWEAIGKTTNAGVDWQDLTPNVGARRIQMFDSLDGWVSSTSGLIYTTDGWASWDTAVAESGLKALHFCNPRHGVAVGLGGAILHTTDAGVTWLRDSSPTSLSLYAVFMLDSVHAWAAGDSGIVLGMGDWAAPGVEERSSPPDPFTAACVWPSPCRGKLMVRCPKGVGAVVIYDNSGRPVTSVRCSSAQVQELDLRRYPAGVYFLHAASSSGVDTRFVLLR